MEPDPPRAIAAVELMFLSFYTVELLLKLVVHRLFFFTNKEMQWNIFDCTLVVFSLADQVLTAVLASGDGSYTKLKQQYNKVTQ